MIPDSQRDEVGRLFKEFKASQNNMVQQDELMRKINTQIHKCHVLNGRKKHTYRECTSVLHIH